MIVRKMNTIFDEENLHGPGVLRGSAQRGTCIRAITAQSEVITTGNPHTAPQSGGGCAKLRVLETGRNEKEAHVMYT